MDLSNQFNTQLSPEDEEAFQDWAKRNQRLGDLYDYDLRGFWQGGTGFDQRGHGSDLYKKPNHPTFSSESKYSGEGREGGTWEKDPETGRYKSFTPGRTNREYYSSQALQDYFTRSEPDIELRFQDQESMPAQKPPVAAKEPFPEEALPDDEEQALTPRSPKPIQTIEMHPPTAGQNPGRNRTSEAR